MDPPLGGNDCIINTVTLDVSFSALNGSNKPGLLIALISFVCLQEKKELEYSVMSLKESLELMRQECFDLKREKKEWEIQQKKLD